MHFRVVHHGRQWPHVANHLDARTCPDCRATVCGRDQNGHQRWHDEQQELLVKLCQRMGISEEAVEMPWTWTAVVDAGLDEPGAIDEGES